jgi:hypothetical protein
MNNRLLQVTLLFCFFLSIYLLTYKGIDAGDDIFHYEVAKNFVRTGRLALPEGKYDLNKQRWLKVVMSVGRGGHVYLTLPPGLALASIPLGYIGNFIENHTDVIQYNEVINSKNADDYTKVSFIRKLPSAFFIGLINPIVSALTVLILFLFGQEIVKSPSKALIGSFLFGLGTIIWPYSSNYWDQPLLTFCIFSSFYYIFLFSRHFKLRYLLFAGLLAGYALLARLESILTVPWLVLYLIATLINEKRSWLKPVGMFVIPFAVCVGLQMLWNFYRFGSLTNTGAFHQALLRTAFKAKLFFSLPANLVSFQRGLFIYSPPLLLFFCAIGSLFLAQKRLASILVGIILTNLLLYSKFSFWQAPASWGPRFLVLLGPFIFLPVFLFFDRVVWKKVLIGFLFFAGLLVQLIGVLLPLQVMAQEKYWGDSWNDPRNYFTKSDIVPQAAMLLKGKIELWWLESPIKLLIGMALFFITFLSLFLLVKKYTSWGIQRLPGFPFVLSSSDK